MEQGEIVTALEEFARLLRERDVDRRPHDVADVSLFEGNVVGGKVVGRRDSFRHGDSVDVGAMVGAISRVEPMRHGDNVAQNDVVVVSAKESVHVVDEVVAAKLCRSERRKVQIDMGRIRDCVNACVGPRRQR